MYLRSAIPLHPILKATPGHSSKACTQNRSFHMSRMPVATPSGQLGPNHTVRSIHAHWPGSKPCWTQWDSLPFSNNRGIDSIWWGEPPPPAISNPDDQKCPILQALFFLFLFSNVVLCKISTCIHPPFTNSRINSVDVFEDYKTKSRGLASRLSLFAQNIEGAQLSMYTWNSHFWNFAHTLSEAYEDPYYLRELMRHFSERGQGPTPSTLRYKTPWCRPTYRHCVLVLCPADCVERAAGPWQNRWSRGTRVLSYLKRQATVTLRHSQVGRRAGVGVGQEIWPGSGTGTWMTSDQPKLPGFLEGKRRVGHKRESIIKIGSITPRKPKKGIW